MNRMSLRTLVAGCALALAGSLPAVAAGPVATGPVATPRLPVPIVTPVVVPATAAEAADLAFMREEEKVARDLYVAFREAWENPVFAAIATSEQSHMNAMLKLLRKYSLPDPAAGKLLGEFVNEELAALYAGLLERGLASEAQALLVGGLVEEVDIADLKEAIARTTKLDIRLAYENLACGSRNHLRAFARTYTFLTGIPYVAQSMSADEVASILEEAPERCGRN